MKEQVNSNDNLGSPPFFRKWSGMYGLVIGVLAVLVIVFHFFSLYFS
ncbi:MAG: hypothetical protein OEW67_08800 [Cyclobacteriaceae bacterium]|nr:hypothetical protein [Cyclobacteriaceae bacterium]